ncbi:glycosyltransferase [Propionicicella superfundia]|uniref:glycosyltransferase n=1 Tax=Propionicicella superfundia TaxID=348582 RepID=UPI00040EB1DD|nr:glycosyltransferase [Propionicicella superfundia]
MSAAARRVVVVDHTGQLGGGEIALLRLLLALGSQWDVTVLLLADGPFRAELDRHGVHTEVLPLAERTATQSRGGLTDPRVLARTGRDSLAFSRELAARLRTLRPDLVVANTLKAAVLTELAACRARLPWVWHLHDRLSPDYLPRPVVAAMRLLARRARHVVANSADVAGLTRLPARRVSVAHPGLPADAYRDRHEDPDPPVFGLLGRISETKGQREFIEAAAVVAREFPAARFRVVGAALFSDQPYAEEVSGLPARLGIADAVDFAGWADDPRAAIDGFTALVHASPVPEPFGQVIVEAMARHVPVVATLGGGVGEILQAPAGTRLGDGSVLTTPVGRLVGPHDPPALAAAMSAVLRDPAGARASAVAASAAARSRFSSEATAETVSAVWSAAARPR